VRVLVILLVAWLLQAIAARLIRVFRGYMARRTGADELSRVETLARVFRAVATIVILIVAGTLILDALGISVAPILATAGVAGLAIGFGAQSLIKDYFSGFFLLLEDQVRQGDVIEVAQKAKAQLRIKAATEAAEGRGYPEWIEVDIKALKGTFKAKPQRSELPATINESLVVELYSK
jgi:small-conductance mechanosensitive channel